MVATGSANELFNSYSLLTSSAISDGLREFYPQAQGRRVFSLTRSSFAGQQRTGAALWSGDISGSWDAMRRQISASLNYQMSGALFVWEWGQLHFKDVDAQLILESGHAYWSMDTGGFFRPVDQYTSSDYLELLVRWFQFAAFTPLMRVHGGHSNTELWNYPSWTMNAINTSAIRLRYRLLPYTYSGFLRVHSEQWTMQRAMAFDFGADAECAQLADQFMYGSAFLVAPFVQAGGIRTVYFPQVDGGWIGFHDGITFSSFGPVSISMPITQAPLFVRASSIVVMGPDLQYTSQSPADPLEIRLYPGTANVSFALLEDDGENSDFTQRTRIEFNWFPASRRLVVGPRIGAFFGMLTTRTLRLVAVAEGHGVGVGVTANPDAVATYNGMELDILL
jgi:alpha-D-xyloside xylohydrolase